jgi:hypothetical protein
MNKKPRQPYRAMRPVHKYSFILRLWRVDQSTAVDWRASLEIPDTGKRIGFGSLEQLFTFLMDLSESNVNWQPGENKEKEDGREIKIMPQ